MPKPKNSAINSGMNKKSPIQKIQPLRENEPKEENKIEKINDYVHSEIKENEIEEGLSEIYQGEDGKMVDVKTMDIKKGKGMIFKIVISIFALALIALIGWSGYNYYQARQAQKSNNVILEIDGEKEVDSGKEFYYTVSYKNLEQTDIKNINIKLNYPENFIFLESNPRPNEADNSWVIDYLGSKRSGEIKIKGKLLGEVNQNNILLGRMTYSPINFSSEFSKEATFNNNINNIGIDFTFSNPTNVLMGDENEISVKYIAKSENFIKDFKLTVEPADNIEFSEREETNTMPGIWQIKSVDNKESEIKIKFKFKDKISDTQNVSLKFEQTDDGQKYFTFYKKDIPFEVMKKNLNLNLIINSSNKDKGIDFGQSLNYSITYSNKGETNMKDIVIMTVLESDFLDWNTVIDKNKGKIKNNKISWTKDEIPALGDLTPNTEGTIDFSIKVKNPGEIDPTKNYQVKSYARFTVGTSASSENSEDSKSNEITNKINSDLNIKERVMYFNDDNIAVGYGPLPPKVGEATGYKVYWNLTNNLNELNNLEIVTTLPSYVNWDNKNRTDLGTINYDSSTRKVTWHIGRLSITNTRAEAEFNITITPTSNDKGKIMVLLPGTTVVADDNATGSKINKTNQPKTTKIEDDQAINDDGIIR